LGSRQRAPNTVVIHYCTYFDINFLTRGIALHRSLLRHSPPFTLWVLCLDDAAFDALGAIDLAGVRRLRLAELEEAEPDLLAVKGTRTRVEYYFTISPAFPRFLLQANPEIDMITYLDADLLFYSNPKAVFDELGDGSVAIVPHRFPEELRDLERHGVYNVGLLTFRKDARGMAVLNRWREQCLEWCFDRIEGDRYADQRYLDAWPTQPGVVVLQHPGIGLAPWNVMRYEVDTTVTPPTVDGHPLVFYHFQGVKEIRSGMWDVAIDRYGWMDRIVRDRLYGPYIAELVSAARAARRARGGQPVTAGSLRLAPLALRPVAGRVRRGQVITTSRYGALFAAAVQAGQRFLRNRDPKR
jgi:hypothetical protein